MAYKAAAVKAAQWENLEDLNTFMEKVNTLMVWAPKSSFPEEWMEYEEEPPIAINPLCVAVVPQGGMGFGVSLSIISFILSSFSISHSHFKLDFIGSICSEDSKGEDCGLLLWGLLQL